MKTFQLTALCVYLASGTAHCGEGIDEFIEVSRSGVVEKPSAEREAWQVLLSWRLARQGHFEALYEASPVSTAEKICSEFENCNDQEAFNLAVACSPFFFPSFRLLQNLEPSNAELYVKLESLREVQCVHFLNNKAFRRRFMRICVWQSECFHHFATSEHLNGNPRIFCGWHEQVVAPMVNAFKAGEREANIYPNHYRFLTYFWVCLTSRDDLLIEGSNRSVGDLLLEWDKWFVQNSALLIQRRDSLGWIMTKKSEIAETADPGVQIIYPEFLLPNSPVFGLGHSKGVSPSFRRVFTW
jgi:hypothetical protein